MYAPSNNSGFTFNVQHSAQSLFGQQSSTDAMTGNSNEGTRFVHYTPTCEAINGSCVVSSISAMDSYRNKSHEELRLEDYKQPRIEGLNPATDFHEVPKHPCFGFSVPAWAPNRSYVFENKSSNPSQSHTGRCQPGSSIFQWKPSAPSNFEPVHSSGNVFKTVHSAPSSFGQQGSTLPTFGEDAMTGNSNEGTRFVHYTPTCEAINGSRVVTSISAMDSYRNKSHEELRLEDYEQQRIDGPNLATDFHEVPKHPCFGFSVPAWAPNMSYVFENKSSNPSQSYTSLCQPSSSIFQWKPSAPSNFALVHSSGNVFETDWFQPKTSAAKTNAIPPKIPVTRRPYTGAHGGRSSNSTTFEFAVPTNDAPSASTTPSTTSSSGWRSPQGSWLERDDPSLENHLSSMPVGLGHIVHALGVNPWAKNGDFQVGEILLCEDASSDDDIASLAEFAVEQHNAIAKDNKVKLIKVKAACLEAVEGGRYHIVLEASKADPSLTTRFYAAVLRKKTDRLIPLIVLERWLPGPVSRLFNDSYHVLDDRV
ncbi:hypothetical protein RND81_10G240700 [Saponaria officinalis]|uniref:Uncharacterized protein n=1 Tax=Saponaria officinalis TaxID=3572 RepID=A0AAW1I776_SAPOF